MIEFCQLLLDRLDRTADVGPNNEVERRNFFFLTQASFGQPLLEFLEGDLLSSPRKRLLTDGELSLGSELAGLSDVVEHVELVACLRRDVQARDVDRSAWTGLF